jgi:anti-sigma B factor antagonist
MGEAPLVVDVSAFDGGHLVELRGELDIATAAGLPDRLAEIAGSVVVVDLEGLTFLDARGLTALLEARRLVLGQGHELKVCGAQGVVRRVFEATKLTSLLSERPRTS